jgi:membrane-bound serine protease (ClpP class)
MRVSLETLLPAVLLMAAWTIFLVRLVVIAQRRRATTGNAGMVGLRGEARTELAPGGWIVVSGEVWKAVANEVVEAGSPVTVESVEGLTLRVRKGA